MPTRHRLPAAAISLLAVALLGSTLASALQAQSPAARGPMLFASIDLERVFNEVEWKNSAERGLDELRQTFDAEKERLRELVEGFEQDVAMTMPGTPQYVRAEGKLKQSAIKYGAYVDFSELKLEAERAIARKKIYEDIIRASESFSKSSGIGYLISADSFRSVESGNEIAIIQQMALRRVLYSDGNFDVTDDLIAWINDG